MDLDFTASDHHFTDNSSNKYGHTHFRVEKEPGNGGFRCSLLLELVGLCDARPVELLKKVPLVPNPNPNPNPNANPNPNQVRLSKMKKTILRELMQRHGDPHPV